MDKTETNKTLKNALEFISCMTETAENIRQIQMEDDLEEMELKADCDNCGITYNVGNDMTSITCDSCKNDILLCNDCFYDDDCDKYIFNCEIW